MKTKSITWDYLTATTMLLLTLSNGCYKEEPEPIQPPIITTSVSDISGTSATCTGNKTFCEGIWSEPLWFSISNWNPDPTEDNSWVIDTSDDGNCNYSVVFDHLTPGTTYYVRAFYYENYGNTIEFTTSGNVTGEISFNPDLTYGSVTDIVGNTYKTIKIGSQTWMAENLKTSKLSDGTDIPLVINTGEWRGLSTPCYCWYLDDGPNYKNPYGALYNWYTVNTGKLCPTGWHVPSSEEWRTLSSFLGGDSIAGGQLRETGTAHWITTDTAVNNSSGFTALPGGMREVSPWVDFYINKNYFLELGYEGEFWSTDTTTSDMIGLPMGEKFGISHVNACGISKRYKCFGISVRCIQD